MHFALIACCPVSSRKREPSLSEKEVDLASDALWPSYVREGTDCCRRKVTIVM